MSNNLRDKSALIQSERAPGRNFDMFGSEDTSKFYADGFAGTLVGPAVSRIDFFQVLDTSQILEGSTPTGETLETRERNVSIVVPTFALIEFVMNTLNSLTQNRDNLSEGARQQYEYIKNSLSGIETK